MADMLAWGLAWQASQFKTNAGIAATLHRGILAVAVTITSEGGADREYATQLGDSPESTTYLLMPPEEGYSGFIMAVADYNFGAGVVQPERGDYLTIGPDKYVLESPEGALPWMYADLPYKNLLWLHTKKS